MSFMPLPHPPVRRTPAGTASLHERSRRDARTGGWLSRASRGIRNQAGFGGDRVDELLRHHFLCSSGFTTSRAESRKSCATGLIARFFNVMTPSGHGGTGSSTGRTLCGGRFVPNFSTESGRVTTKDPLARRESNKWGEPVAALRSEILRERKASVIREPASVSDDGRPHGSFASSASSILRRLLQRLGTPATTKMRSSYRI